MRFGFDLLREQFAKDDLLGEILCANYGMVWAGRGARRDEKAEQGCDRNEGSPRHWAGTVK
jgi:hypothetical protein